MGLIQLEGMEFYAYHGCLLEEGKIGSDYRVDVKVKADLNKSTKSDELKDTKKFGGATTVLTERLRQLRSKGQS